MKLHRINVKKDIVSFIEEVAYETFAKISGVYLGTYTDAMGKDIAIVALGSVTSTVVRHIPMEDLIIEDGARK